MVQGVIVYFRMVDGRLTAGDDIRLMNTGKEFEVLEVGVLAPKPVQVSQDQRGTVHSSRARMGSGLLLQQLLLFACIWQGLACQHTLSCSMPARMRRRTCGRSLSIMCRLQHLRCWGNMRVHLSPLQA